MKRAINMLRALSILIGGLFFQATSFSEGPTFDVASVKLLSPDIPKVPFYSGGPASSDPARLHLRLNMSGLLIAAFAIGADQIKGPAWFRDFSAMPFYDIIATMPPDTNKQQVEKMLQNLLVERFHLAFHRDTRSFPGYELVVNKGGPKLKEVTPDPNPATDPRTATKGQLGPDGFPIVPGPRKLGWRPLTAHLRIKYQEWRMPSFASDLGFLIGRSLGKSLDDGFLEPRIIDKTGLTGNYTFILEYDCPACAPPVSTLSTNQDAGIGQAAGTNEWGGFPDIFGAVQKQLGLRLNKTGDVQVDVIVVDIIDKVPAVN
jgi:uncharacterized protein (TIGR03435 family)